LIYPTRFAAMMAAAGVPLTLVVAAMAPGRWYLALAWPAAILALTLFDALLAPGDGSIAVSVPDFAYVGETRDLLVTIRFAGPQPPVTASVAIAASPILKVEDDGRAAVRLEGGAGAVVIPAAARRRGTACIQGAWVRWQGSLGLAWCQLRSDEEWRFPVLPDLRPLHDKGAQLLQRHAIEGLLTQAQRGEGADFDALVEYRAGMDRRAIDWKQSARHMKLHAKEYRVERNAQIVFAVDAGRQMSDPVAGLPRLDRAVSAALLAAWVALKLGDRVALHAFDSRPRIASGLVSGAGAFGELQRLAAAIDYSADETNYTFALTTLSARLSRRSMIVLFTEFTDLTSSDFMVRAARRLVATHLLLVVVLRDEELEAIVDSRPEDPDDVTRAVTAAGLLAERRLAILRLQHLGVHVIEAPHDKVGEALVAGYLGLKRRNLL
jgi:uncharacterized protein (DUF58 family)